MAHHRGKVAEKFTSATALSLAIGLLVLGGIGVIANQGTVILGSFFAAWSFGAIFGAVIVGVGEELQDAKLGAYRLSIGVVVAIVAVVGLDSRAG